MPYYEVLKKLWPVLDMTGELDHDLGIEGKYLDLADSSARAQLNQFYPNTATGYDMTNWMLLTDTTNRAGCLCVMGQLKKKDGWMNPDYFVDLCGRYNLDATVYEGIGDMFRCGFSAPPATPLPHATYEMDHLWTWLIDTTGTVDSTTKSKLQTKIIEQSPAWTEVSFGGTLA
jgi:hypothetical protein